MKYILLSLTLLLSLLGCSKPEKVDDIKELEQKYKDAKSAEKIEEMKAVVEKHENTLKGDDIRKKKAERWHYGVQQLMWVSAATDAGLIDKDIRPKKTAYSMRLKIDAWMDLKSDAKPYFGDPREVPKLLRDAGYSEERIQSRLQSNSPEQNPYIK